VGIGSASAARFGKSWAGAWAESSIDVAMTPHITANMERKAKKRMVAVLLCLRWVEVDYTEVVESRFQGVEVSGN
jgi:hypothetical protein